LKVVAYKEEFKLFHYNWAHVGVL